jgi:putative transposase
MNESLNHENEWKGDMMLSDSELLAWHARRGTYERAQSVISHVRSSAPARRAGGGRRNVAGRYPSKKMGVTIHFASHRCQLAAIYELEHDADVLEYYDRPPAFKLDYRSAAGRRLGVLHTADYFVIRENGAGWEDCKTQEELVQISQKNSGSTTGYGPLAKSTGSSREISSSWTITCAVSP